MRILRYEANLIGVELFNELVKYYCYSSSIDEIGVLDTNDDIDYNNDQYGQSDFVETPNVWCPECGYGFFVTDVGFEGLNCPNCGATFMP